MTNTKESASGGKQPCDSDMYEVFLELGGLASVLIGGPQGALGLRVVKVLKTLSNRYETPPELKPYHDLIAKLAEAEKRRGT